MTDPDKKDVGNPEGKIYYLQFIFLESKQKAETENPALLILKAKDIAKLIVKAELFKNGELVHFIERHNIEGRSAQMIAENLIGAFEQHCN